MGVQRSYLVAGFLSVLTYPAYAQVTVGIEDYATIPGGNARMSVMTADPAGRLFVNDQLGQLYSVSRGTNPSVSSYLNFSGSVTGLVAGGERGFQSFAFHPDFYNTGTGGFGKFYTMHTSAPPEDSNDPNFAADFTPGGDRANDSVLLEWETNDPNAATFVPANANQPNREVVRFEQPFANHNAGQIAFNTSVGSTDPDRGNLYVALGDGGGSNDPQNNGQNAGNPYGAILRIDPLGNTSTNGQYGIVTANAFATDAAADGTLGEVYSYGLRNPQRLGWDNANGDLYIADIGQNAVEEINMAVNGGNFGWDVFEGTPASPDTMTIGPVAEYNHDDFLEDPTVSGRAITMGEVVRGSGIAGLDGQLLLGDFPNGIIFTLDVDNDPLAGGSDGLEELVMINEFGQEVRLLDLIQDSLDDENVTRADLRFSYGIDGEVFILNKRDNVIRRLVSAVPEPSSFLAITGLVIGLTARRRRSVLTTDKHK